MPTLQEENTKKRLEEIEKEIAELKKKRDELYQKWQKEKLLIQRISSIKADIENYKQKATEYERQGLLDKVAEIRYGTILNLEKELKLANEQLTELQKNSKMLKEEVDAEDIAEVVSKWTNIPVQKMLETEKEKLIKMEERIHQRLINQEEAVSKVANAIRRSRAGLQDRNRPIGSFIFLGSTGVGKTELAKALAEFLFDDENAMVRIDMSEYMEKHSVSRLIGAPPGYVGYEEGGQLTEAIRRKPYSVVLLDEIEKAHYEVFNILLQVLDDGRLTDNKGRTVNFKNCIIIMTSNLGTSIIQNYLTDNISPIKVAIPDSVKNEIMNLLRQHLRPEFLNRVDDIIIFSPLSINEIKKIADLQLKSLRTKLKEQGFDLSISNTALELLANLGYDYQYGARPLKRAIQKYIVDPLALKLLSNEFAPGDTIKIDVRDGQNFIFTKAK